MKNLECLILILSGIFTAVQAEAYDLEVDGIYYNYIPGTKNVEVSYSRFGFYEGDFIIPPSIQYRGNGYRVTGIGENAFYQSGIVTVKIPNSVVNIGDYAFKGCSGLSAITLPAGVTAIGEEAFRHCTGLTSITVPKAVKEIGIRAFYNCSRLKEINVASGNSAFVSEGGVLFNKAKTVLHVCPAAKKGDYAIPAGVTAVAAFAFGESRLSSITFPAELASIGSYAFDYCKSLATVALPAGLATIGEHAFSECEGLASAILPDSLEKIPDYMFYSCQSLKSVTLPGNLQSIGSSAFASCRSLEEIHINAAEPPFYDWNTTFNNVPASCIVYVPAGSQAAYQKAAGWNKFQIKAASSYQTV